jgi:hypothetical protein
MRRYICVVGIALAALGSSYAQPQLVSIENGISGDGRLTIPVDPFGAWYVDFTTGASRGELYDPAGALRPDYPTFATGTYLFVGTSYRVALNQEPGWGGSPIYQPTLTATVTARPTALNYAYNDGIDDTAIASFTVTSDDNSVNLSIDMLAAVRRPAYVVVRYRITNNASSAISFKLYRAWDLDLYWRTGQGNDFANDEVCGGVYGGQGYPYQGEFGLGVVRFALSSLNPTSGYVAAKNNYRDDNWPDDPNDPNDCPTMGYGTDIQEWNAYGIPACWVNYVAYFGVGPGCSGDQAGDGHIGVEVPVSLAAGGSATVTFIHTYGSGQPATCNLADVNLDGTVDDADLLAVLFAFGNSAPNADVDVNFDGVVDDADLLEVLFNFGNSC